MSSVITQDEIKSWLVENVAKETQSSPQDIKCDISVEKLGVDSVAVGELFTKLSDWLGKDIDPTISWDYPTIDKMAAHLAQVVSG